MFLYMEANPHTGRRHTGSVPRALPAFWVGLLPRLSYGLGAFLTSRRDAEPMRLAFMEVFDGLVRLARGAASGKHAPLYRNHYSLEHGGRA